MSVVEATFEEWLASQDTYSWHGALDVFPSLEWSWPAEVVEAMFADAAHLVDGLFLDWRALVPVVCGWSEARSSVALGALIELVEPLAESFAASSGSSEFLSGDGTVFPLWDVSQECLRSMLDDTVVSKFRWDDGEIVDLTEMAYLLNDADVKGPWAVIVGELDSFFSCGGDRWVARAIAAACVVREESGIPATREFFDDVFVRLTDTR